MSQLQRKFEEIYDKYVEKIYRFVYLKVNSQEIAEDLCSEIFTRGWESFKQNKCDIKNIQAFLYQIARNLIVDHYREKAKVRLVSVEMAPVIADNGIGLEEQTMLKSDFSMVQSALAGLKDEYREAITLYYLNELSVPEMAKILGKSEEAVRVQIHRALEALRGVIK